MLEVRDLHKRYRTRAPGPNVVAAAIVLVFNYVAGQVINLHAMVQHNVITDRIGRH